MRWASLKKDPTNIQSHGCYAVRVDDVFHSLSSGFMCLSRGLILIKLRSY